MDLLAHTTASLTRLLGDTWRTDRLVVAVSGGADSAAMLAVLTELVPAPQIELAHFNHRVRGEAADVDAAFCADLAKGFGTAFALAQGAGTRADEATLRRERRVFLLARRAAFGARAIVTAHHADDALETILMRLLRGTGLHGLGGISPWDAPWLRPWLEVPRDEVRAFANSRALAFREDASNASPRYLRNRVRHELVPVLARLAEPFGGHAALLRRTGALAADVRRLVAEDEPRGGEICETAFWTRIPEALWRSWGERAQVDFLRGRLRATSHQLERTSVNLLRARLAEASSEHCTYEIPGLRVERSCAFLFFSPRGAPRTPVITREADRWMSAQLAAEGRAPHGTVVRTPQPGDRWRGRKLSDCLLTARVPAPERKLLPVVAEGSEVRWCRAWPGEGRDAGIALTRCTFPWSFAVKFSPTASEK